MLPVVHTSPPARVLSYVLKREGSHHRYMESSGREGAQGHLAQSPGIVFTTHLSGGPLVSVCVLILPDLWPPKT